MAAPYVPSVSVCAAESVLPRRSPSSGTHVWRVRRQVAERRDRSREAGRRAQCAGGEGDEPLSEHHGTAWDVEEDRRTREHGNRRDRKRRVQARRQVERQGTAWASAGSADALSRRHAAGCGESFVQPGTAGQVTAGQRMDRPARLLHLSLGKEPPRIRKFAPTDAHGSDRTPAQRDQRTRLVACDSARHRRGGPDQGHVSFVAQDVEHESSSQGIRALFNRGDSVDDV